tara:strand:- start:139 stop:336 length:198 start_codon:yes stop_codon:yes gene_type:complete
VTILVDECGDLPCGDTAEVLVAAGLPLIFKSFDFVEMIFPPQLSVNLAAPKDAIIPPPNTSDYLF